MGEESPITFDQSILPQPLLRLILKFKAYLYIVTAAIQLDGIQGHHKQRLILQKEHQISGTEVWLKIVCLATLEKDFCVFRRPISEGDGERGLHEIVWNHQLHGKYSFEDYLVITSTLSSL